eukprot:gene7395-13148_t
MYLCAEIYSYAEISKAHCSCKAGSGGHCNHVFALLFQINDFSCSGLKSIPIDSTCTSRSQQWHTPRASTIASLPVMGTHFANPATDQEPFMQVNTVLGNVPVGSCLSYQLFDFGKTSTRFELTKVLATGDSSVCLHFPDVPRLTSDKNLYAGILLNKNNKEWPEANIMITADEAWELEKRTVLQGECKEWGLIVNPAYPHLGASPDGKIFNPGVSPQYGLLEVKCPYKQRAMKIEEALADPSFYISLQDGSYMLKKDHASGYFEQVQGQMALSDLEWCDFFVFSSESNKMCVARIEFDTEYWRQKLLPKLNDFYFQHCLQFLIPRV